MKKILAFIICLVLVCAMPLVAFAEGEDSAPVGEEGSITENLPAEDETVTEGEKEGETDTPEPTPEPEPEPTPTPTPAPEPTPEPPDTDPVIDPDAEVQTVTEKIEAWFERNSGALSIVVAILGYGISLNKAIGKSNKSIATSNNNTISIAERFGLLLTQFFEKLTSFEEKMTKLLDRVEKTEEEKQKMEKSLIESNNLLKSARMANKELADEVAELLVLANIPNSKKDELYARHRAAVAAIEEVEKAAEKTEVMENVEQEA